MQSLTVTARVDNAFTVRASGRFESEVAPLIAAAPDMLAQLQRIIRAADRMTAATPLDGLIDDARDIVARATGQA